MLKCPFDSGKLNIFCSGLSFCARLEKIYRFLWIFLAGWQLDKLSRNWTSKSSKLTDLLPLLQLKVVQGDLSEFWPSWGEQGHFSRIFGSFFQHNKSSTLLSSPFHLHDFFQFLWNFNQYKKAENSEKISFSFQFANWILIKKYKKRTRPFAFLD